MGSDSCCSNSSSSRTRYCPTSGLVNSTDYLEILPLNSTRRTCGYKKKARIFNEIHEQNSSKHFMKDTTYAKAAPNQIRMPDLNLDDITYTQQINLIAPITPPKQIKSPITSLQNSPLRMPNLNLDDETYTEQMDRIAPLSVSEVNGRQITTKLQRMKPYQTKPPSPRGAVAEVLSSAPNHFGLGAPVPISYSSQPPKPSNLDYLMETLKHYENVASTHMPTFGNAGDYQSLQLTRYDNGGAQRDNAALRAEIRNLVRSTEGEKTENRVWLVLVGLVHILQAALTTAAVLVYYLVWCYTQMMYFIMKSMLFFHNAEGSMKFAIGLVTVTSVLFAYSIVWKVERMFFGR